MSTAVAVGIDVGGTRLRAASVSGDGRIVERRRASSPADAPETLAAALAEVAGRLGRDLPVGVGIAGLVDTDGVVRYGPNIRARDLPLGRELGARVAGPVLVTNDASAAVVAEQRVGAASGHDDVVLLTLGTGVGGGLVAGGRPLVGGGLAGELGHVVVRAGGRRCPCGSQGCLEAYASGTAIAQRARALLDQGRDSRLARRPAPAAEDVVAAAHEGDDLAVEVIEEAGYWLGIALASLVNALDPGIVVLGGGAARALAPWVVPEAERVLGRGLVGARWRAAPPVVLAKLDDDAGVVGAALLAASGGGG